MDSLFDDTGRLLPRDGDRVYAKIDRRYFSLEKHQFELRSTFERLTKFLVNPPTSLDYIDFERQANQILENISLNQPMKNLLNATRVPFIIPKINSQLDTNFNFFDLARPLNLSYREMFPSYEFKNFVSAEEGLDTQIVDSSRYRQLLEKALVSDVVGWYFPNAMAGFAVPDQRRVMNRLPDNFILSGPLEATISLIGNPSLLMKRDGKYPNLLCLSAVEPKKMKEKHFFFFYEAYGWNLYLNKRSMVGAVSEYFAGGLTVTI